MNLEELVVSIRDNGRGVIVFDDREPSSHDRGRTFFLHTQGQKTHQALVRLGWTPPGEKAKVRLTRDDAETIRALACSYDDAVALQTAMDLRKKEAQDALAKLGIEYP